MYEMWEERTMRHSIVQCVGMGIIEQIQLGANVSWGEIFKIETVLKKCCKFCIVLYIGSAYEAFKLTLWDRIYWSSFGNFSITYPFALIEKYLENDLIFAFLSKSWTLEISYASPMYRAIDEILKMYITLEQNKKNTRNELLKHVDC